MKSNQKSVRLSDRVCKHIEGYRGQSFNEKLENMVLDYMETRENLVEEWARLQAQIGEKRDEYWNIIKQVDKLRQIDRRVEPFVDALVDLLKQG